MVGEWQQIPLEDGMEALIDYRGKTPTKTHTGVPLITAKVVKNGRIETPNEFISHDDYDAWMRRGIPQAGDVLITTEAPLGEVAQLGSEKVALAQRLIALRGKNGVLDNTFLKFLLQSDSIQNQLRARASGSTVSGIKQSELRKINLLLPPPLEQRAIAHILGTLDDKIELNRRRNQTLEAMARALFKDWFVDFGPVRAKMEGREPYLPADLWQLFPDRLDDKGKPEGWESVPFGQLLEGTIGGDWGKEEPVDDHDQAICIIRGTDIPDLIGGSTGKVPTRYTTKKKLASRILQAGDIVVEVSGGSPTQPTGRSVQLSKSMLERFPNPVVCASFCRRFRPKNPDLGLLAAHHLTNLYRDGGTWEYQNQSTGIANFQTTHFLEAENVLLPSERVLEAFVSFIEPILAKTTTNDSITLAQLRDALLPKLISGELRIADAEKFMGRLT